MFLKLYTQRKKKDKKMIKIKVKLSIQVEGWILKFLATRNSHHLSSAAPGLHLYIYYNNNNRQNNRAVTTLFT